MFDTNEFEVVWHGGMKSPYGGFTKGELLLPRNEETNPTYVTGNQADDDLLPAQRAYDPSKLLDEDAFKRSWQAA